MTLSVNLAKRLTLTWENNICETEEDILLSKITINSLSLLQVFIVNSQHSWHLFFFLVKFLASVLLPINGFRVM